MMSACLRSVGWPAALRKLRTMPIVGASPAFASSGSESLVAQSRYPREGDRAVLLKRRRLARDDFWGVKGNLHSHQPGRVGDRTLERCLVQPFARLTPVCRRIRLHSFAERQAATGREKKLEIQSASGVRPLDFRDHKTPVPSWTAPTARERDREGHFAPIAARVP